MVSQEIRNNAAALGVLMHQVSEEQAAMLRLIRSNLVAAADTSEELERGLSAPAPQFKVVDRADIKVDEDAILRMKGKLYGTLGLVPQDCPGKCEGCKHARTEETQ